MFSPLNTLPNHTDSRISRWKSRVALFTEPGPREANLTGYVSLSYQLYVTVIHFQLSITNFPESKLSYILIKQPLFYLNIRVRIMRISVNRDLFSFTFQHPILTNSLHLKIAVEIHTLPHWSSQHTLYNLERVGNLLHACHKVTCQEGLCDTPAEPHNLKIMCYSLTSATHSFIL